MISKKPMLAYLIASLGGLVVGGFVTILLNTLVLSSLATAFPVSLAVMTLAIATPVLFVAFYPWQTKKWRKEHSLDIPPKNHAKTNPHQENKTLNLKHTNARKPKTPSKIFKAAPICYADLFKLTPTAARYMATDRLTMRNTHTEQLLSLHLGKNNYPQTHSSEGIYAIPLWTVVIPNVTDKPHMEQAITEYINEIRRCGKIQKQDTLLKIRRRKITESFDSLNDAEQKEQLENFVYAIKQFVAPYAPMGYLNSSQYNFEILITNSKNLNPLDDRLIDDFGRYQTGGRALRIQNAQNMVYRATLNGFEIAFLKKILAGRYDHIIPGIGLVNNLDVLNTVRMSVCNAVATDILVAKLVQYLNSRGRPTSVICLDSTKLSLILHDAIRSDEISKIIKKQLISSIDINDYITAEKRRP